MDVFGTIPEIKVMFKGIHTTDWIDISNYVITFSVNHNLDTPTSGWNIVLKADNPLLTLKQIVPNDMIKVFLSNDGGTNFFPTLAPGFVCRPSLSKQITGQGLAKNINISGKTMGKYLEGHQIIYMPQLGQLGDPIYSGLRDLQLLQELMADEMYPHIIVKKVIEKQIFSTYQELSDGQKLEQWLDLSKVQDTNVGERYEFALLFYDDFFIQQGPVWPIIKEYSNPQLNELFLIPDGTIENAKTYLVLRPKPFNSSVFPGRWSDLKQNYQSIELNFESDRITSTELGISDDEVYNFWLIKNELGSVNNEIMTVFLSGAADFEKIKLPIFDPKSAKRYGFRSYQASTPFVPVSNQTGKDLALEAMAVYTKRVFEWYCLNDVMESGPLNIMGGLPEVKVGSAIIDTSSGKEYYCQGFNHMWNPGRLITVLNLNRGLEPAEYDRLRLEKLTELGMGE